MKAAVIERPRGPVSVTEIETPQPKAHEILVRVVAAGVNPIDWKIQDRSERSTPFVLGQDFAGVVSAVGNGVKRYRVTERVFGIARDHGAYAEYTVVPEYDGAQPVSKIPDDVGDADAAALPTPGLTALAALDWLGVTKETTILILGAAGGVGGYAVQIARDRGAFAIGTGRSTSEEFVRSLGAHEFVAYDREDVVATVRAAHPCGVDAILDLVDDREAIAKTATTLRPGGKIVSTIGALDVETLAKRNVEGNNLSMARTPQSSHEGLRTLAELVERGALRVTLADEKPLAEVQRVLDESRNGSVNGKLVLTIA